MSIALKSTISFNLLLLIPLVAWGLEWMSLDKAKRVAKSEHKLLLVELTSPRCHYCRWMEEGTLKDSEVERFIQRHFIPVRIDVTKEKEYEWSMTPTFLIMKSDGGIIKRIPGAWKKEDFMQILKEVVR